VRILEKLLEELLGVVAQETWRVITITESSVDIDSIMDICRQEKIPFKIVPVTNSRGLYWEVCYVYATDLGLSQILRKLWSNGINL